ncbi:MAG: host attachment protein [Novosphingobium sp.]|nr:host attachment protein [Novosphingobium sp.]
MLLPKGTVFALVDGEQFELYRNEGLEAEPKLKAMPLPDLKKTNMSSGMRRHTHAGYSSDEQLDEDAHAIAVADWLNSQVLAHKIDKLVIAADPRSLGEMRKRYHKELEEVLLCDLDRTLTGASTDDIVKIVRAAN